ncbi:MAG: hypothetical protein AAB465_00230 [Patescibacteria group bacterium]
MMKRNLYIFLGLFVVGLLFGDYAKAIICQVCTLVVCAGLGLSRWLGVDDTISGVWIGGLTISLIVWTVDWLNKKNIRFKGRKILIFLSYYLIILVPLYWGKIMGHPLNTFCGMDKLLFGILSGSIVFAVAAGWYVYLKKKNNNRAYFPFQKVVMPVGALLILSAIFYFLSK